MTDNPREQLYELGTDAAHGWRPTSPTQSDVPIYVRLAVDAVLSERELVIAALGGERFGTYLDPKAYGPDHDRFTLTQMHYVKDHAVPLYRFSSVGESER